MVLKKLWRYLKHRYKIWRFNDEKYFVMIGQSLPNGDIKVLDYTYLSEGKVSKVFPIVRLIFKDFAFMDCTVDTVYYNVNGIGFGMHDIAPSEILVNTDNEYYVRLNFTDYFKPDEVLINTI